MRKLLQREPLPGLDMNAYRGIVVGIALAAALWFCIGLVCVVVVNWGVW